MLEYLLFILIVLVTYFEPYALSEFSQSNIGKVIFLIFIIMLASKNSLSGFLGALLFIVLLEKPLSNKINEGFTSQSVWDLPTPYSELNKTSPSDLSLKSAKRARAIELLCIPSTSSSTSTSSSSSDDSPASNIDSMSCMSLDGVNCTDTADYSQFTGISWNQEDVDKCDICDALCTNWDVVSDKLSPDISITYENDRLSSENMLQNRPYASN